MKKHLSLTMLAVLSALPLAGCNLSGARVVSTTNVPTLGQQLIDLQKAKDAGAITSDQYEAKKAELLKP